MRARFLAAAVATLVVLTLPAPAGAQVVVTCSSFTLLGNYVMTLGGVDAGGHDTSRLAFITMAAANGTGAGQYTGTMFVNPRGGTRTTVNLVGSYQIFSNCVVHLFIPDDGSINTVTGFVLDFGDLVVLSTAFDPEAQLTGTLRKIK